MQLRASTTRESLFAAWGRQVHRHPKLVGALSAAVLLATGLIVLSGGSLSSNLQPSGSARDAANLIRTEIPQPGRSSFELVLSSSTLKADDAAFRDGVASILRPLASDPRVTRIDTPYSVVGPAAAEMTSRDAHRVLVIVNLRDDFQLSSKYYEQLRSRIRSTPTLTVLATGDLAVNNDLAVALDKDLGRAEFTSLPISILLLLLVFGGVLAALLPLGVGVMAIVGGLAAVFVVARFTDTSELAINLVTLLGLGVAIDYSLFIVSRYREELRGGRSSEDALATTVGTAGRSVAFSGLTVAVSLLGLLFFSGTFLPPLGVAASVVVGLAVVYALTFLPATLALLGPKIELLRLRRSTPLIGPGLWAGIARGVMRRPVFALVPAVAALLIVGSPFLRLQFETSDLNMLPSGAEARRGHAQLVNDFPGQNQARIPVVVQYRDGSPLQPNRLAELYGLSRSIAAMQGVSRVESIVDVDSQLSLADYQALYSHGALPGSARRALAVSVGPHIVVLNIVAAMPASTNDARELVRSLRSLSVPEARLLVTGESAFNLDTIDLIRTEAPLAIGFVIVVTCLILFFLLRSVLLPIKAVVMTLMSITASFGALVWIFQDGHLSGILAFTPSGIDPALPVLLFCTVFGLSMDYEVLLMSRIQEVYRRTNDNRLAVAEGLQRSGPLITGAALIMIAVFGSFAFGDVILVKAIGLGLALAVLLDASIIRMIAVPALMRLLGDLNWWAPRFFRFRIPLASARDAVSGAGQNPPEHLAADAGRSRTANGTDGPRAGRDPDAGQPAAAEVVSHDDTRHGGIAQPK